MRRAFSALLCAGVLTLIPSLAFAQQQPTPAPAGPQPPVGIRVFFLTDLNFMAATQTFDAVVGSSMLVGVGGGADITNLYKGVFARVGFSRMSKDGERVVVDGDEVFPVGIPLTVKMTPFEIGAGWRLESTGRRRIVPYFGGGFLRLSYAETSEFAEPGDDTSEGFNGSFFFGGVDIPLGRVLTAGVEGQYRIVSNAIGEAGVSQAYDEHDLGGFTLRFLIGFRK